MDVNHKNNVKVIGRQGRFADVAMPDDGAFKI